MPVGPLDPASLAPHYQAFLRPGRVLLTGHSHQAWPDVARAAMLQAFEDAAAHVDDKWAAVMARADRVRAHVADLLGARADEVALAANTHELVSRFLSALDLRRRPHLVTTTGEFHSLRRQLLRLSEAGVEVTWVDAEPAATLSARLAAAVRPQTAAVLASSVLFRTATVVPELAVAVRAAHGVGAQVLVDAYHHVSAMPFSLAALGPDPVFVVGGGYKYAQWGEGCCWLRVPTGCALRPIYTGWFSDFAGLADASAHGPVGYGADGAHRFAGSTFEPTSVYRAAAVCDFFAAHGLTPARLRALSLAQTEQLIAGVADVPGVALLTPRAPAARGAFVALRTPHAGALVPALRARGVFVDARGDVLRMGPAPYLTAADIDGALGAFRSAVAALA